MNEDMPEVLAVRRSGETWATYLCRSGRGGSKDTNYYREDKYEALQIELSDSIKREQELEQQLEDKQKPSASQPQADSNDLLYSDDGYYCIECKCLCETYEQGLSCHCDNPWVTEVLDEEDYPDKWVLVKIEARRI